MLGQLAHGACEPVTTENLRNMTPARVWETLGQLSHCVFEPFTAKTKVQRDTGETLRTLNDACIFWTRIAALAPHWQETTGLTGDGVSYTATLCRKSVRGPGCSVASLL